MHGSLELFDGPMGISFHVSVAFLLQQSLEIVSKLPNRSPSLPDTLDNIYASNIARTRSILCSLIPEFDHTFPPVIHIAGTKGKGSTCALICSLLQKYLPVRRVALYTSPHLRCITERMQINRVPIKRLKFASLVEYLVCEKGLDDLFQFQLLTIIAFLYFSTCNVDIVVVETGIGGSLDPTNIFPSPVATIITSIGWDHTDLLGTFGLSIFIALIRRLAFLHCCK